MNPWLQEGDCWYDRNKDHLSLDGDKCIEIIERNGLTSPELSVYEIGCADGYRLEYFKKRGHYCGGFDISEQAINIGKLRNPTINLRVGSVEEYHPHIYQSDIVIVNFVLHWVDRAKLFQAMQTIDSHVKDGGYLVIGDFHPDYPVRVEYHHRQGLYTWKQNYPYLFCDSINYETLDYIMFDHETKGKADYRRPDSVCAVHLLRKGTGHEHRVLERA